MDTFSQITVIIEVRNPPPKPKKRQKGDPKPETMQSRLDLALHTLLFRQLQGCNILFVNLQHPPDPGREPCVVPDFGHNYLYLCAHPEPQGVTRHFGYTLTLQGVPLSADMGRYEITPDVQMEFCGLFEPRTIQAPLLMPLRKLG